MSKFIFYLLAFFFYFLNFSQKSVFFCTKILLYKKIVLSL